MEKISSSFIAGSPYAFVSYTHRDEVVLQVIEKIQQVYNIWWDAEMVAGERWDSEKAMPAIEKCECVLVFYSRNYVKSNPCRNEVESALKCGKKIIPVSVEGLTLVEIIKDVETKLEAESEELRKIQKLCSDIGGGEKSTAGNKVLYVDLSNESWADGIYKALDKHLKPTVYLREWLVNSDEYKREKEMQQLELQGLNPNLIDLYDDDDGEGEYIDYSVDDGSRIETCVFISRLEFAIKNNFDKLAVCSEEEISARATELCYSMIDRYPGYEYGNEKDNELHYRYDHYTILEVTEILYDMVCKIPLLNRYMKANGDFFSKNTYSEEDIRNRQIKINKWMNSKNFFDGDLCSHYMGEECYDEDETRIGCLVQISERFMQYLERTYPNPIKTHVLKEFND